MIYNKIQTLEFELSSSCNAYCSVCPRYIEHNGGLYENPNADLNSHLTPAMVKDIMTGFPLDEIVQVDCIGTVGDPLANKDIVEIVAVILEHVPHCSMQIHTNGSLRNTKTFEQLAQLMPYNKKPKIVFSIDGLVDTNHLYRKNVDFQRVMDNANAFIKAGGNAQWKMIEFTHNRHQIETAKKLATALGFKQFDVTENQSPDEMVDRNIINGENTLTIYKRPPTKQEDDWEDDEPIEEVEAGIVMEPQCELGQYIHIRADGLVFPCCMTAGNYYNPTKWIRQDVMDLMGLPADWNNLHKRSFSDIMYSAEWSRVKTNYDSDKPCWTCADNCAIDSSQRNKANHIRENYTAKFL
tara:strand:+ start:358 stop:1416 length:1059 start_codon:yes stop_codon:yes gene_type:complete